MIFTGIALIVLLVAVMVVAGIATEHNIRLREHMRSMEWRHREDFAELRRLTVLLGDIDRLMHPDLEDTQGTPSE